MAKQRTRSAALFILLALLVAACSGGGSAPPDEGAGGDPLAPSEATEAGSEDETASGDMTEITLLMPAESPIEYPHRVAQALGYYEEEGLDVTVEYAGGSSEVIQQLLGGSGEIGVTCAGAIIEGLSQGFTEMRPVFNTVYGSIFGIAVPGDSDISEIADLKGKTIGISDPAGGEVPIVRGLLKEAGLSEDDVNLLPIGEATAVGARAIEQGQVDALGGSLSDFFGLTVQGVELEQIGGESIKDLPACGVVVTEDYLESERDLVEGFLRGTAKGQQFGLENFDGTVSILAEAAPEAYEDEKGPAFLEAYMPFMTPPEGEPIGTISPDSFDQYFEFAEIEKPEDLDLDEIVVDDLVEAANDYDTEEVSQDAADFEG